MEYRITNHFLHLILTLLFFVWGFVWLYCYLSNSQHNRMLERMERKQQADKASYAELIQIMQQHRSNGQ